MLRTPRVAAACYRPQPSLRLLGVRFCLSQLPQCSLRASIASTTPLPPSISPSPQTHSLPFSPPPPPPLPTPAPPPSWIDHAPCAIQPYLHLVRLDKPAGTYMLFLPCTWSITMAAYASHGAATPLDTAAHLALFGVGALVMRGAGCTINDLWDRDLDKRVLRTRGRPLAAGTVSVTQAVGFLAAQLTVGLGVLMQLNWYSIFLGAGSLVPVVLYPLMKRVTYWPQAVLGLAFNYGALLGWASVAGVCEWTVCLPLYAAGISWTLVYDTVYALQDKKDDVAAGIKSTALRFGDNLKPWLSLFSATTVAGLAVAGYANSQGVPFYVISVGGAAAHLAWQVRTLRPDDTQDAWSKFKSNAGLGALVAVGVLVDTALRASEERDAVRDANAGMVASD
ncbi:Para-hydroxybenzoate--polyprenyltransferase, mitochondrial precursor (PHB:polyprenyltransferase) [Geranomyces variabilis]|uniref:4-hydroxybenzoate polyprenyltransferase, mitochondrial n=1 Tax=Geranomyces variabilis TaxID=109894 RepID=A0AAD5XQ02_9FUNG|nr:Para-hydroxybenzoate--polyprenyltransferase, mitochondrial precursor (PHB:polyprenyltransferase) [Geranomyces variabilis]